MQSGYSLFVFTPAGSLIARDLAREHSCSRYFRSYFNPESQVLGDAPPRGCFNERDIGRLFLLEMRLCQG